MEKLPAKSKVYTLLRREMLEYRNSLLLTPIITGALLIGLMTFSVILANRISVVGIDPLNAALNILHLIFLGILAITGSNYLANSFYQDRRDRSILFWKSMPVSEWEEIFAKLAVICVLAPGIYVFISIITQIACILLGALLIWRIDANEAYLMLKNIQYLSLFGGQVIGWLLCALWLMPAFAWLMLCSSIARRSPMMLAFAVPIALYAIEIIFFESNWFGRIINNYLQYLPIADTAGGLENTAAWSSAKFIYFFSGLGFAALLLIATHWLRKYRFAPQ